MKRTKEQIEPSDIKIDLFSIDSVVYEIFMNLDFLELFGSLLLVNTSWRKLLVGDSGEIFWKKKCFDTWPSLCMLPNKFSFEMVKKGSQQRIKQNEISQAKLKKGNGKKGNPRTMTKKETQNPESQSWRDLFRNRKNPQFLAEKLVFLAQRHCKSQTVENLKKLKKTIKIYEKERIFEIKEVEIPKIENENYMWRFILDGMIRQDVRIWDTQEIPVSEWDSGKIRHQCIWGEIMNTDGHVLKWEFNYEISSEDEDEDECGSDPSLSFSEFGSVVYKKEFGSIDFNFVKSLREIADLIGISLSNKDDPWHLWRIIKFKALPVNIQNNYKVCELDKEVLKGSEGHHTIII